jgi:signal transduction histidine kinase
MQALEVELAALAQHLRRRRGAILQAWRDAVRGDPALTTGDALPRTHLNDHIPGVLSSFERELSQAQADAEVLAPEGGNEAAAAHGLHRWQQGYDLREVTRELGRLNECMVVELEDYAKCNPQLDHDVMARARRIWATSCSVGIEESTAQYFRLQQVEAAGHLKDLERALENVREMEQQRAELWWQLAHDLRGNVGIVANATAGLTRDGIPDPTREKLLRMLERNVSSLHHLLDDVTSLARLQAGREGYEASQFDVAALMQDFCEGLVPYAEQRGLYLRYDGPAPFLVEGDAAKTRRLTQNIVLNAVKYTLKGGVTVSWGNSDQGDNKRWALTVQDTGPGFHAGPGAPLAGALEEATRLGQNDASITTDATPAGEAAEHKAPPHEHDLRPVRQGPGEGIGLSIVKRLCELLSATVELESSHTGTTFRILLPRHPIEAEPASA